MAADRAAGTSGYAGPPQLPYARVGVPDPMAPIDLPARTFMARLRIRRPLLTIRAPGGLSDFLQALTDRNPSVSVVQVNFAVQDTKALEEVARATANPEPNATVRLHVHKAPVREPLFSTNKPTTKKLGKDLYTFPHPHKHTHRYVKPHVPSTLPNCSLSPDTPYCWQPDKMGRTTPCLMEAPSNFIPLPLTHPPPPHWPQRSHREL